MGVIHTPGNSLLTLKQYGCYTHPREQSPPPETVWLLYTLREQSPPPETVWLLYTPREQSPPPETVWLLYTPREQSPPPETVWSLYTLREQFPPTETVWSLYTPENCRLALIEEMIADLQGWGGNNP